MNKIESYKWAAKRTRAQVERNDDIVAILANTAAILKEYRPNFFWVGFYIVHPQNMVLGPFQGPPACVKLSYDQGVCAACAEKKITIVVPDVHQFSGHVACDSRSQSEIVTPVFDDHHVLRAVLDVDSIDLNDFDEHDVQGLESIAALLQSIWTIN